MVKDSLIKSTIRQIKYLFRGNKFSKLRLKSLQNRPQGGSEMVKGVSKRVIVVKFSQASLFDEAVFVVKEDALGIRKETDVLKEAQREADNYIAKTGVGMTTVFQKFTAPVYVAAGAAATGIAWLFLTLVGI